MKLLELRRNHEINTGNRAKNVVEQIEPYFGRDDAFISMIDIPKIGIPPRSGHYGTPTGIYTYPLSEPSICNQFMSDKLPYKSHAAHVALIIAQPGDRWLTSEQSEGQIDGFDKHLDAVMNKVMGEDRWKIAKIESLEHQWKADIPASFFYCHSWMAASILAKRAINPDPQAWGSLTAKDYGHIMMNTAGPAGAKRPGYWNGLLRRLGIDVVADYGTKMIYDVEPFQACFLTKGAINHYTIHRNGREGSVAGHQMVVQTSAQLFRLIHEQKFNTAIAFAFFHAIIEGTGVGMSFEHSETTSYSSYNPNIRLSPAQVRESINFLKKQDEFEVLRLARHHPNVMKFAGISPD